VTVILEPTRNAWVPLSAWLQSRGATVILVPPEQSADLRDYYNKHTKTDRLDSKVLARLPLLHPEGLRGIDNLGPARVTAPCRASPLQPGQAAQRRQSASRRTRRAVGSGVGRLARIGHGIEDRPGHLGEIRRSTGAQASRGVPGWPRC
jgi:transposase